METFKYIELKNYPFYFACSDGNIYSKRSSGKGTPSYDRPYKKLSPGISNSGTGYYQVNIRGKESFVMNLVHRLIAEAFIGEIPEGMTVSHRDGKKFNNVPSNLLIESHSDNIARKYEHGTMDSGCSNSRALITEEQLIEIRKLLIAQTYTHQEIGDLFNVSRVFITKINTGVRYKK